MGITGIFRELAGVVVDHFKKRHAYLQERLQDLERIRSLIPAEKVMTHTDFMGTAFANLRLTSPIAKSFIDADAEKFIEILNEGTINRNVYTIPYSKLAVKSSKLVDQNIDAAIGNLLESEDFKIKGRLPIGVRVGKNYFTLHWVNPSPSDEEFYSTVKQKIHQFYCEPGILLDDMADVLEETGFAALEKKMIMTGEFSVLEAFWNAVRSAPDYSDMFSDTPRRPPRRKREETPEFRPSVLVPSRI